MKAISLWQPWASYIAKQIKWIETRGHNRFAHLRGETIAIHAAKKWDEDAFALWLPEGQTPLRREECPLGAIVATAFVSDHRRLDDSDAVAELALCRQDETRYGLYFSYISEITPVPWRGAQGVFYVPDHVIPGGSFEPN